MWETAPSEVTYVFEKEVIFHEFDFEKSSIWKHITSCDKVFFPFFRLISRNFDNQFELKFSQVWYVMYMLRYSKWED